MKINWQIIIIISLMMMVSISQAQSIIDVCPDNPIQQRTATFEPSGIILTSFDSAALWVYDIVRNTRYPLPETRPCTSNCHLSPDRQWFIYLDPQSFVFSKMRLDGTQRTPLVTSAAEVRWWNQETLLIWSTNQTVSLRPEADTVAEGIQLPSEGVISVQPNGYNALQLIGAENSFARTIVMLDDSNQTPIPISEDRTYFNAAAWSPIGDALAYVGTGTFDDTVGIAGAELFLASTMTRTTRQVTSLFDTYGAVRVNGYAPSDLSWSPTGTHIAFWVIELMGNSPTDNTGDAVLHILDINSLELRRYCGFAATEHTPETPRLVWSPDGSHVAFAGNVAGDDKGALLLALNKDTGIFTELSSGMFPVYGIPQINGWGTVP
ncbi:MAG: hypothetical protein WBC91_05085 [Phototrophicaceae bacterium]